MLDFKVKELKKQPFKKYDGSELHLNITGNDVNHVIINTLRRAVLDLVPTYAFVAESIIIEENTSIFDNDELKNRLSGIPIFDVDVPVTLMSEDYWKNINYSDPERKKHPDDNKSLEMYIIRKIPMYK